MLSQQASTPRNRVVDEIAMVQQTTLFEIVVTPLPGTRQPGWGSGSRSSYGVLGSKFCIHHTSDFSSLTLTTISLPSGLKLASYLPLPGKVATMVTSLGVAT
jgi:hypothetical protein